MKKRSSMLMSILLVIVVLAGCGSNNRGGQTNDAANSSANSDQKVTISIWVQTPGWEWVSEASEQFERDNPSVNVEVSMYGTEPIKENLKVAASSKTLPDVWFSWGGSLGAFYPENGLALDLTEIAEQHNYDEIYNSAALEMSSYNGKLYGVPIHLNVLGMWYPKTVFESANLKEPTTFDEFEQLLADLKETGVTPLTFGSKGGWHTMRLAESLLEHFAGPELHDQLLSLDASWNDPAVVQTFKKLKEYTDKEYFPRGYVSLDPAEAQQLIYQKTAGLINEGSWFDGSINDAGFDANDYEIFKFPTDQNPVRASVFAEMFQINASSSPEKQEAAIKLAEYLTSVEVINEYVDTYGSPATLNTNAPVSAPHQNKILESATEGSFLIMDQALPQQIIQKWFEAQDRVALGDWTPEQAAEEVEKAVQEYKKS